MSDFETTRKELQEIVDFYKLSSPLDDETRAHILNSTGSELKDLLKKTGKYGIFTAVVTSLSFMIHKNGIPLAIIKILTSVSLTVSVPIASYVAYNNYFIEKPDEHTITVESIPTSPITPKEEIITRKVYYSKKFSIKLNAFDEQNIDPILSKKIMNVFQKELKIKKEILSKKNHKTPGYILTGSLLQLGDEFVLFVKLIDASTTEIVYTSSNKAVSAIELLGISEKIAQEIPLHLKK